MESDREFIPDTDTERMAQILFTSGTTGSSKCVMLCQRNIFSVVTSACTQVYFCKEDVLVSVLPLHHTYELAWTLAATNFGAKICINDSIRHALKNFKEYQPTGLVLVPLFVTTMYKKIQSEAKRSGKDKILSVGTKVASKLAYAGIDLSEKLFKDVREAFGGRLHKIICGGAALNPEMIEAFEAFGISIYEGYGITECSPLVCCNHDDFNDIRTAGKCHFSTCILICHRKRASLCGMSAHQTDDRRIRLCSAHSFDLMRMPAVKRIILANYSKSHY